MRFFASPSSIVLQLHHSLQFYTLYNVHIIGIQQAKLCFNSISLYFQICSVKFSILMRIVNAEMPLFSKLWCMRKALRDPSQGMTILRFIPIEELLGMLICLFLDIRIDFKSSATAQQSHCLRCLHLYSYCVWGLGNLGPVSRTRLLQEFSNQRYASSCSY